MAFPAADRTSSLLAKLLKADRSFPKTDWSFPKTVAGTVTSSATVNFILFESWRKILRRFLNVSEVIADGEEMFL